MARKTERFRKDHEGLLKIAHELGQQLDPTTLKKDASPVCKTLSRLSGTLKVHLTAEDNQLYPELLTSKNSKIKSVAETFVREMGGIKDFVGKYAGKWMSAENIQKDPNGFITETKTLLGALSQRIDKENKELYEMIDKDAA